MVYVLTLSTSELTDNITKLQTEMRLTKAFPKSVIREGEVSLPRIVLLLSNRDDGKDTRYLEWMGVAARLNTIGAIDCSITIDPLRPCLSRIPIDEPDGLLADIPYDLRTEFSRAASAGSVGICGRAVWEAFDRALRTRHPTMAGLVDWLLAQADPPRFDSSDAADRSWQEQKDCADCLVRISGFPYLALAAWQRPAVRDAPYLSGLIPQPYEQSMIEHDIRTAAPAFGMFGDWWQGDGSRCDIHILIDRTGRRLEIANVNATPAENRTGTDMIYYHESTQSLVLVQYKRLDPRTRSMRVNERFYNQLDRLGRVADLSRSAIKPSEWRLGDDSCFMKLSYWPEKASGNAVNEPTPGMYLPVSYVRLLLKDDSTRGERPNSKARILSYKRVDRHLISTQFIELVKHGLVGTVGVTPQQLHDLVSGQIAEGQSVMVGAERSSESVREREVRLRRRGPLERLYEHQVIRQQLNGSVEPPPVDPADSNTLF
jgi:hypothetical protein